MTVEKMLNRAKLEAGSFQRSTAQEVRRVIAESEEAGSGLDSLLVSIRERRNGWLAHLDPKTIADPKALEARAKLTVPDLERAFKETEKF